MEIEGLKYEKETTWDDVFRAWQEREGTREEWQHVAKQKGWQSWEEWRSIWVRNFGAQDRQWHRYRIIDPVKRVPGFRIGPTQSWQRNFPEKERNQHTFASAIDLMRWEENNKVQALLETFPEPTEFIGIHLPDSTIITIEGHHRAGALAIVAKKNQHIAFTQLPTIAITFFREGEEKLLNIMLIRGSKRENYPQPQ